ncbi:MAG: hypothetical protein PWP05_1105 [Thermovirga sp.]|nr:hypothetical protein [Thermovirga sp.]
MKISIIQMNIVKGNPDENFRTVESKIREAALSGPDVILLPEMWNTSYALEEILEIGDSNGKRTKDLISSLAKEFKVNIVAGSVAAIRCKKAYNRLMVFNREGEKIAEYDKIHLFGLMDEDKYITPGKKVCLFELDGIKCGAMICYDLRFPELARELTLKGSQVIFVPAQWPEPRIHHWKTLMTARAIENQVFMVAANRVGVEDQNAFVGGSMAVDPLGQVLAELTGGDEGIVEAHIDFSVLEKAREAIPVLQDRRPDVYKL